MSSPRTALQLAGFGTCSPVKQHPTTFVAPAAVNPAGLLQAGVVSIASAAVAISGQ
jgi:hypothetical protein